MTKNAPTTPPAATSETGPPADAVAELGFTVGQVVGVDGERDTFRVVGVGPDGSLTVVGGPSRAFRSFLPEWCFPVVQVGHKRKGRLPPERRGLRAAWSAEHGCGRSRFDSDSEPDPDSDSDGDPDGDG